MTTKRAKAVLPLCGRMTTKKQKQMQKAKQIPPRYGMTAKKKQILPRNCNR
jgi:hypothetical protein